MDEMTNSTAEQEQTSDSFMAGWDDEPLADETVNQPEETTTERQEAETSAEETTPPVQDTQVETASTPEQSAPQEVPKTWTLNHLGEAKTVDEAGMVVLAQKGMDYDRIRSKWDEAKPVMELFGGFARQAGMSISDYVSHIRTQAKQQSGMSEAEARRTVELEDREAAVSAREAEEAQRQSAATQAAQAKANADARRNADIAEFQKIFPDVARNPKSIPQEVWTAVNQGVSLVAAYSKYAVAQAQAAQNTAEQQAAAAMQNQKNTVRSTGSMKTAGDGAGTKDPFLADWD